MPRIRTIKPEFVQSETIGRLTRDARLLFIQLWTIADDSGKSRASSRMLASLLFPYDDDAPGLIDGWLCELEREGCILRYEEGGSRYLQVLNWLKHQKIAHPTKSRIPDPSEDSRTFMNPPENFRSDLGPRTLDHGIGPGKKERGAPNGASRSQQGSVLPADWMPSEADATYALEQGFSPQDTERIAQDFADYWHAKTGKDATKRDWPATWRRWCRTQRDRNATARQPGKSPRSIDHDEMGRRIAARIEQRKYYGLS